MTHEQADIRNLYQQYLNAWNNRDAHAVTALTDDDCILIGFDGSHMHGHFEIENTIGQIFKDHQTSAYVGIVKEVRFLSVDVAVLRSIVGMIPPQQNTIKPDVNAIQIMTAIRKGDKWLISVFQNTPAAFHGRPELVKQQTEELQHEFDKTGLN
jgi:uncharacterized protein (TIGR02246 family)